MLPGKKYTPEDILQILRRRIWLLLVPLSVISASTAVAVRQLPDSYRAETLILVVPQRVPESYVRPTVTTRIEDRLHSIQQQILSRTRLERIIQDFDLYSKERRTGIMEDIVEGMRRDIKVDVVKGDAFSVAFVGRDPRTVMRVTDRLASLFIEENLRDRDMLASGTSQFLEAQVDDARRRLMEQEKKLEDYRRTYSGQLPTQLDSNLQAMQNTQMQIQSVVETINRDRDRRQILERQLEDLTDAATVEDLPPGPGPGSDAVGAGVVVGTAAQQLVAARATHKALQQRFKPGHPDLKLLERRIGELERLAEADALDVPVSADALPTPVSPAEVARQRRIDSLRLELRQLDQQIANLQSEEKRLRDGSADYQRRIEAAPTRESELTELMRDYKTLDTMYSNLLANKEESKIAANLERRQIGEQFKLLDPARVPERPFSPDRQRLNVLGIVAGLVLGLGLIALLEYRDASFKADYEVTRVTGLPVLAVVPVMQSDAERRRFLKWRLAVSLGLGTTVAGCLAVVVYTFVR